MNHRQGLAHLFNHYGMAIVLAFLCLYYSWATFTEQQPRGVVAAKLLAKQIVKTGSNSLPVLIVARTTEEDTAFVSACAANLEAAGFVVAGKIQGDPRAARETLQKLSAQNTSLGFIATTADCAAWTLFESVPEKFPALGHPRVVFAASYKWPSFLKGENLLNIANQITVVSILAVGMTVVIITGGIDLSVGSLIALAAVVKPLRARWSYVRWRAWCFARSWGFFLGSWWRVSGFLRSSPPSPSCRWPTGWLIFWPRGNRSMKFPIPLPGSDAARAGFPSLTQSC